MRRVLCSLTLASSLSLTLAACGQPDPTCGSEATRSLVRKVVSDSGQTNLNDLIVAAFPEYDDLARDRYYVPMWKKDPSQVYNKAILAELETVMTLLQSATYSLENVRTESIDKQTKKVACAAQVNLILPGHGGSHVPITYTVQNTDEGKIYVEVWTSAVP